MLNKGDIIVFVTDGVHDNLDPEELGEEVSALGLPELAKYNTWEDVPNHEIEKVKSMYMCHKLARLYVSSSSFDPPGSLWSTTRGTVPTNPPLSLWKVTLVVGTGTGLEFRTMLEL